MVPDAEISSDGSDRRRAADPYETFGGEKVLMLMDPVEKEEAFFCYDNGRLLRQSGYYIYYEKNPQMQAYMLEKNPELNQPEQELVADDAVKTSKDHSKETYRRNAGNRRKSFCFFLMRQQSCLVLAVLTVGVQFIKIIIIRV